MTQRTPGQLIGIGLFGLVVAGGLFACKEESASTARSKHQGKAIHEQTLGATRDPVEVEDSLVLHLEAHKAHSGDLGDVGTDRVPFMHREDRTHAICFPGDLGDVAHQLIIRRQDESEVGRLTKGECKNFKMKTGSYIYEFQHGAKGQEGAKDEAIFMRPMHAAPSNDAMAAARREAGMDVPERRVAAASTPLCVATGTSCSQTRMATFPAVAGVNAVNEGEVAAITGTCPTSTSGLSSLNGTFPVYSISCPSLTFPTGTTGFVLGPQSQLILVPAPIAAPGSPIAPQGITAGDPIFLKNASPNDQVPICVDSAKLQGGAYSLSISSINTQATHRCEVNFVGQYCHKGSGTPDICGAKYTKGIISNTLLKPMDSTLSQNNYSNNLAVVLGAVSGATQASNACCTLGYQFAPTKCTDLALINFDLSIYRVILGNADMVVQIFADPKFAGRNTTINSLSTPDATYGGDGLYQLPDSSDPSYAGAGTPRSLIVETMPSYLASTLITTGSCTGCNLTGVDLSSQNLDGVHLNGATLDQANLTYARLTNAQLGPNTDNKATSLIGVKAEHIDLSGSVLDNATFYSASSSAAPSDLNYALIGCTETDCTSMVSANLQAVSFQHAQFLDDGSQRTTLQSAKLDNADFTGATIVGVILSHTSLSHTLFTDAVLLGDTFIGITNNAASMDTGKANSFSGALIYGCDMSGNNTGSSNWGYTTFADALFSFVHFTYNLFYTYYDEKQKSYATKSELYGYGNTYPMTTIDSVIMPVITATTRLPDGSIGGTPNNGGESKQSCPSDCQAKSKSCLSNWNCIHQPFKQSPNTHGGHFSCDAGSCSVVYDDTNNCGDGVCNWLLGETFRSCPKDCQVADANCNNPSDCADFPWPAKTSPGHWDCQSNTCTAVTNADDGSSDCGNMICNTGGGESLTSCPADCKKWTATDCYMPWQCASTAWPTGSAPGHWECQRHTCTAISETTTCGDALCDWQFGETPKSCPNDCATFYGDCWHASQCVDLAWPDAYTASKKYGHWECQSQSCVPVIETAGATKQFACGASPNTCDMNGQYLPTKIPDYLGVNDPNAW